VFSIAFSPRRINPNRVACTERIRHFTSFYVATATSAAEKIGVCLPLQRSTIAAQGAKFNYHQPKDEGHNKSQTPLRTTPCTSAGLCCGAPESLTAKLHASEQLPPPFSSDAGDFSVS
jgi:hypothetical protein